MVPAGDFKETEANMFSEASPSDMGVSESKKMIRLPLVSLL